MQPVYGQELLPIATWGDQGVSDGNFKSPSSVAVDSAGNVYVADTGNNRIQKFSGNGTFVTKWGTYGTANGSFNQPHGIGIITQSDNESNSILVADTENNRIQMFSDNGTFITQWGRYGISNGNFKSPSSVAVDSASHVHVADTGNNRIQMFSDNGTFITQWGRYGSTFGNFKSPSSIAVDSAGNVYVADTGNNRIQKFSGNGDYMAKWGRYGSSDQNLKFPSDITVQTSGDALVADTGNNRIKVFNVKNISTIQQRENVSALNLTGSAIPPASVSQNTSLLASEQAIIPSVQEGGSQELLKYVNTTYGIRIQYPKDWTIKDNYRLNPDDPYITVVSFFAPPGENLTMPREEVSVYIDTEQYTTTLEDYVQNTVLVNNNTLAGGWENLQIIKAEQNSTLAERPAYKVALTYTDQTNGGPVDRYLLDTGTVVGDKVYVISYWAHPQTYSKILPAVQKMMDSFEILVNDTTVQDLLL
jgi:sugar lactone lactonase YvrE